MLISQQHACDKLICNDFVIENLMQYVLWAWYIASTSYYIVGIFLTANLDQLNKYLTKLTIQFQKFYGNSLLLQNCIQDEHDKLS